VSSLFSISIDSRDDEMGMTPAEIVWRDVF